MHLRSGVMSDFLSVTQYAQPTQTLGYESYRAAA
jgi:hypothetical protein